MNGLFHPIHMFKNSIIRMNYIRNLYFISYLLFVIILLILSDSNCVHAESTIHWHAPFYSGGGYSSEAIDFAIAAHLSNVSLQIHQHGDSYNHNFVTSMLSVSTMEILKKLESYPHHRYTSNQLHINICHSEPGAWHAPRPKYQTTTSCPLINRLHTGRNHFHYSVGRTMFETDSIPSGWVSRLNYMDEVWVPTSFARDVFVKEGVDSEKIMIVPEPVDTELYQPKSINKYLQGASNEILEIQQLRRKYKSIFLFVGKWETRKGVQLLIETYIETFSPQNDVLLLILSSGYHSTEAIPVKLHKLLLEIQKKSALIIGSIPSNFDDFVLDRDVFPPLKVIQNIPQAEMPFLYSLVDAVVIPSLGEGWGRPHVESLSCGTPVIATNWSGVTAYLNEENGYPIAIEEVLIPSSDWQGHNWANPKNSSLSASFLSVYRDPKGAKRRGDQGRLDMVRQFSLPVLGKMLLQHVERIQTKVLSFAPGEWEDEL